MKVGVVDIGTVKVKFLIVDVLQSGELKTAYQSNTLTRLGVRMHENANRPHEKYLQDTISELTRCKSILDKEQVKKIRVVSTHALREMGDIGVEIIKRIKKETGLNVEIISSEEEANLFFQAVIKDFETDQDFTVVDVGGGSVQILIGNRNRLKKVFLLKTGSQYLFDRFSPRHTGADFPTREEIKQMENYILEQLNALPANTYNPVIWGSTCVIDVLKALHLDMGSFEYSQRHPYTVTIADLEHVLDELIPTPYEEREVKYPFEVEHYMWGIDKALLNILSICKKHNSPYVIPTNANINEGLIQSLLQ